MKKFIFLAIVVGLLTPLFAQTREFYYLLVLAAFAIMFMAVKRTPLHITDILIVVLVTIPLHTLRLGGEEEFVRLSEIAFIPLLAWWLIQRVLNKADEPLTIRKEYVLLGLYLLVNISSTVNSILPWISIRRIIILAYLFIFAFIVTDIVNTKERLKTVLKAMILISGISGIIALAQSMNPRLILFTPVAIGRILGVTFYRAGVGWHDPNYYALYMAMNAAVNLAYLLSSRNRHWIFKVCFVLQIIGLMATFSRTVFMSLIITSLYLLFVFGRKRLAITAALSILLAVLLLATSTLTIYKKSPFFASVIYRVADITKLEEQPTLIMGHRYAAFKANWAMFKDHPLLGVGPFMAMYNFYKYRPAGYDYPLSWLASHNQYLQLLAEKGIFGFIIFIAFILLVLRNINRFIRAAPDEDSKTALVGFKAAIFVYLIAGLALENSYELQFWLTIGLCMALFGIIKREILNAS